MFEWMFGNKYKKLEEKTEKSFSVVKKDVESIGKWLKHLDSRDKELFELLDSIKDEISTIKYELTELRDGVANGEDFDKNKQVLENKGVYAKQTGVGAVGNAVQTGVQTANFYGILRSLTANERLIVLTLMNSDMKLSYEDLALLIGKERSTIRGQVNSIKQKNPGLILEISEKNGKKRVYIPEEIRGKLAKYAKVRVGKTKKVRVNEDNESDENVKKMKSES